MTKGERSLGRALGQWLRTSCPTHVFLLPLHVGQAQPGCGWLAPRLSALQTAAELGKERQHPGAQGLWIIAPQGAPEERKRRGYVFVNTLFCEISSVQYLKSLEKWQHHYSSRTKSTFF